MIYITMRKQNITAKDNYFSQKNIKYSLNCFNKIGKFAGAGSLIPITGFANSIVSPAMEYKSEGYVMGVGAKMFTVAGPVLVYGISASIIVGIIYIILF